MINELIFQDKQLTESYSIYEDIDFPLENRDYDVLQDEKNIQIQIEKNISFIKNEYVDQPKKLTLSKQKLKNLFKNLINQSYEISTNNSFKT